MQVGHDQQTSANCKSNLWFGLDKQLWAFVLNFNFSFQAAAVVGGRMTIPNLHKALPVACNLKETLHVFETLTDEY
jgi:hypothetical protein